MFALQQKTISILNISLNVLWFLTSRLNTLQPSANLEMLSTPESNIISGEKADLLHGALICHISLLGFSAQPFGLRIWSSISPGAADLTNHTWGRMQTSESWGKRRFLAGTSYPRLVPTPAVTSVTQFPVLPAPKSHWLLSSHGKIWVTLQEQSSIITECSSTTGNPSLTSLGCPTPH